MLNLIVDLSAYGYRRDEKTGTYIARAGYDTSPIEVVATSIDVNSVDGGLVGIVFFDGYPVFRTLTEREASATVAPVEDDDISIYGTGKNGRARIYPYDDRCDASLFLALADIVGYTSDAYESFVDDESSTVGGTIEDKAVDGGLEKFAAFVAIVTDAVRTIEDE